MLETEITLNRFLLGYARMLLADIADERLAEQPLPGVNHPAWIVGHLAYSADRAAWLLGGEKELDAEWARLFGPGSQLSATRSDYPSKDELLRILEERFQEAQQRAGVATAERLQQPNPNPRLREQLPSVRDASAFLMTAHFGLHLGQLSSWRRMIGLAPMF